MKNSICIFYYSGHGTKGKDLKRTFLSPVMKPEGTCQQGFDMIDFRNNINTGFENFLIIMDCCHAGRIS